MSLKTCNIISIVILQNQKFTDTSFDIEIIHHLWVICSKSRVFILPTNKFTISSESFSGLTSEIEKNIGILCSQCDIEKIYEFKNSGSIYKGYILNLNFVEELKQFVTERTGGKFLTISELGNLLRTEMHEEHRDAILSLLDYLRFR